MLHTPGPFSVHQSMIVGPVGQQLAQVYGMFSGGGLAVGEGDANARLFAAAPDLLAALKELREWHKNEYQSNIWLDARADAAIAKAEGKFMKPDWQSRLICWSARMLRTGGRGNPMSTTGVCKECNNNTELYFAGRCYSCYVKWSFRVMEKRDLTFSEFFRQRKQLEAEEG